MMDRGSIFIIRQIPLQSHLRRLRHQPVDFVVDEGGKRSEKGRIDILDIVFVVHECNSSPFVEGCTGMGNATQD